MKQTFLFAALGLVAASAGAQEFGRVISSTPVIQQVAVPRTYCSQAAYVAPPQTSGAGGLMGAIAGGAIGSTIGGGSGTAAAMLLGTIGGAILGNNIEAGNARAYPQQVCNTETSYENRAIGYDVVYEYAGREYRTRLANDPGATIPLQVTPVGVTGSADVSTASGAIVSAPPVVVQHAPVVVHSYQTYPAYPAYPVYGPPAYYAPYPAVRPYFPIGISLGYTYHRHRHRH